MKKGFCIFGMLILLVGSVYFDQLFYQLEKFDSQSLQTGIHFWTELPVYVVFALMIMGLAWFVLVASPRSLWVTFIFIVTGLFTLVLMTKFGMFEIWPWIQRPTFLIPWLSNIIASPLALTRHGAALILIIGLGRLLPEKFLLHRSNQ